MPGKIEGIPFLSQVEDVDKYLLEYRSLKLMPQTTNSFQPRNAHQPHNHLPHQMRHNLNSNSINSIENAGSEFYSAIKGGGNNRAMQMGNYGNVTNNGTINGNSNNNKGVNGINVSNINGTVNRKKCIGNSNQGYRFNNSGMRFTPQYQSQKQQHSSQFTPNPAITNHYKQAYSQLYYNTANSSSTVSLDRLNSPFYGSNQQQQQNASQQQQYSSSNSSPSPAPQRADNSSSGASSIPSYNGSFDYSVPISNDFNNQFSSGSAPFSNYLNGGLVSSTPIAPTAVAAASASNNVNLRSSSNDITGGFPSASLISGKNSGSATTLEFEHLPTQAVLSPPSVSNSIGTIAQDSSSNKDNGSGGKNAANQFLMNDYSVGWGSNHVNVSSANSGAFGIWNNDMSVWS